MKVATQSRPGQQYLITHCWEPKPAPTVITAHSPAINQQHIFSPARCARPAITPAPGGQSQRSIMLRSSVVAYYVTTVALQRAKALLISNLPINARPVIPQMPGYRRLPSITRKSQALVCPVITTARPLAKAFHTYHPVICARPAILSLSGRLPPQLIMPRSSVPARPVTTASPQPVKT